MKTLKTAIRSMRGGPGEVESVKKYGQGGEGKADVKVQVGPRKMTITIEANPDDRFVWLEVKKVDGERLNENERPQKLKTSPQETAGMLPWLNDVTPDPSSGWFW
jgi:hypothetical protein